MKLTPAAWMCPECKATETNPKFVGSMENHEGDCTETMEPLFTRDDLVRAVAEGMSRMGGFNVNDLWQVDAVVDEMLREGEG